VNYKLHNTPKYIEMPRGGIMEVTMKHNLLIVHGGGPTAVLNSSLWSNYRSNIK